MVPGMAGRGTMGLLHHYRGVDSGEARGGGAGRATSSSRNVFRGCMAVFGMI
jgi:hypothetical protein